MCFGGGNRTEQIYQSIKPEDQPLPSLSMSAQTKRRGPSYRSYEVRRDPARSLLMPMSNGNG